MELVYLAIVLSLPLIFLPFYFASRPTYKRLSLFLGYGIALFIALNYLHAITPHFRLDIVFWYSIACYFILSFLFQNNVYLFYSNVVGFIIGWEVFKIPIILWEFSDEFNFINIFGIPIWRPFSYINKLRKAYDTVDLTEYETSQQPIPNLISKQSQIQVTRCKFHKLVRADTKEKYGNCYLLFSGSKGATQFIAYADRSLLQIKPVWGSEDAYKIAYISRLGWPPKLNSKNSYDLFGTFSNIPVEGKLLPGIYLRALRKHKKGFSPNLFIHWLSTVLLLLFIIALLKIHKG